jgi:ribosomal protein S27E
MKVKLPVYEMLIDESDESDLMVDFIALVDKPAIQKDFMKFAEGMPHYTAEGVLWEGPTHKDADGRLMTGAVHTADSVYLYHEKQQMITCKECGHSWAYVEGGQEPYKCNMCNYVNEAFESYSDYPDAVKNNAKAALKYADENGWGSCGTEIGKIRANQLAKGEAISFETIKRMYSYLSRHAVDLESSKGYEDGCGKLMYDAWGGKSALTWAESKINQIERNAFAIQSEEQRIISGPLMVANQRIKRYDEERGEYEVFFSPATIKKIAIKLAKKGFQNNVNLMHSADMQLQGVTLFEIFQSDKERGIMPMKGFEDLADGSLFGSMYVDNDNAWQLIKEGKVKGFSVEGNFGMKGKDKYDEQMEQIISILSETN